MSDDDAVSIKSVDSAMIIPAVLSPERRISAMRALDESFSGKVPDVGVDEEQALVSEAFRAVRNEHRPNS